MEPARATVEIGGRRLDVEGTWDSAANVASVRVENGIPTAAVLPALPDGLRRMLEESVEPLDFPLRTEAQLGPASPEHLADTAEVHVEAGSLRAWGMAVAGVSAEVRREGNAWRVPKATLTLDKEGERSALVATGMEYDAEKGTFSGRVKGKVRPDALLDCTMLGTDSFIRNILERFGFTRAGDVDFRVRGRTEPFDFVARGNAAVKGASLHGVTVDTAETLLAVTPTNLTATAAKLTRPEGWARGEVSVDFDACTVRLDADTTFSPRAVCQMLGPTVEEFAAPFKMEGPCHSSLKGTLDYHNFARTRLEGHAEGEQLGYGPWVAEIAAADVRVNGYRVDISNASGKLWGGDVKGEASFFPVRTADTWHFEGAAEGTKVSLADALAATFEKPSENMHGAVSFSGNVGGDFGDGLIASLNGDMRVSVADGLLFQTRLLSGLSSTLQFVIPGFDWFAQTDASATVSIRNGVARTEDANIAGPLFGVKAKGSCDAAGRTLNFQVEVKLLDRGILATLVHIATAPVTRLLKFRLSGTLDDPHWSAVNLNPKKLLKIVTPSTYTGSGEEKNSGPAKPLPVPTAE